MTDIKGKGKEAKHSGPRSRVITFSGFPTAPMYRQILNVIGDKRIYGLYRYSIEESAARTSHHVIVVFETAKDAEEFASGYPDRFVRIDEKWVGVIYDRDGPSSLSGSMEKDIINRRLSRFVLIEKEMGASPIIPEVFKKSNIPELLQARRLTATPFCAVGEFPNITAAQKGIQRMEAVEGFAGATFSVVPGDYHVVGSEVVHKVSGTPRTGPHTPSTAVNSPALPPLPDSITIGGQVYTQTDSAYWGAINAQYKAPGHGLGIQGIGGATAPSSANASPQPHSGQFPFMAGDWNCPSCGEHNFAKKQACRKCQLARPADQPRNVKGKLKAKGQDSPNVATEQGAEGSASRVQTTAAGPTEGVPEGVGRLLLTGSPAGTYTSNRVTADGVLVTADGTPVIPASAVAAAQEKEKETKKEDETVKEEDNKSITDLIDFSD